MSFIFFFFMKMTTFDPLASLVGRTQSTLHFGTNIVPYFTFFVLYSFHSSQSISTVWLAGCSGDYIVNSINSYIQKRQTVSLYSYVKHKRRAIIKISCCLICWAAPNIYRVTERASVCVRVFLCFLSVCALFCTCIETFSTVLKFNHTFITEPNPSQSMNQTN